MPKATQITIRVANKTGVLAEIASALSKRGINIKAFLAPPAGAEGGIHLVVDKPAIARKACEEHGWSTTEEEIAVVTLADKPGTLSTIASKLAAAGINIQYAYTAPAKIARNVNVYLAVEDVNQVLNALR